MTELEAVAPTTCRNHPDVIEGLQRCTRCGEVFCTDCLVPLRGYPYCAVCKNEQLRDLTSGVDTRSLDYAGVGRRWAAITIDGLLFLPFWAVIFYPYFRDIFRGIPPNMNSVQNMGWVYAGLWFIYDGIMTSLRGQTVGKMALRIRVVREDGSPISRKQGWFRAVMRSAMISVLSFVNYGAVLFTKEKTCIHDMIAKTRVVNLS